MARRALTALDAAWLHMDAPNNPMVITAVLWLRRPLPLDTLCDLLQERLVDRYPRFSERVVDPVGRAPCWEPDPAFDLRRHVHHVGLPDPGGRKALQELVSDRMSTPMDLSMAPWQFDLVDGYLGGCALICRIHHSVADGISLARVLLQMTDAPATLPEPKQPAPKPTSVRRRVRAALHDTAKLLRHPERVLETLGLGAEAAIEAERLLMLPPDPPSDLRQPLTLRKVAAWSGPIPLAEVKAVGKRTSTTVNDVLVAVLATALHEHLVERGTPVDQVRAFIPVNLRPLDEPVPKELGNQFSIVVLPLAVGPMSSRERLAAVHREMQALKGGTQAGVVWALLNVMGASPAPVEDVIVDIMGKKGSLIVTNVPGPQETLELAGVPVGGVMVWVPQSGSVGLGVSILSYDGDVTVGVCGDADVIGDPDGFVERYVGAWQAMRDA